jgi:hypothetical protein
MKWVGHDCYQSVTQKSPKQTLIYGNFGRVTQKSPNAKATKEKSIIPEN